MIGELAMLGSTDLAALTKAANFLRETTWGAINLTPVLYPGAVSAPCSDPPAVCAEADALIERLGVPPPARVIIANKGGCSFTGWGEFGGRHVIMAGSPATGLLAHELGHTFTLPHNITPLADPGDPMSSGWRHWNAKHRGQIDWYLKTGGFAAVWPNGCFWDQGCEWTVPWDVDAEEGQDIRLAPAHRPPGVEDVIAARVPAELTSDGRVSRYLSIEYRRPVGFDAGISVPRVLIHLAPPYNCFTTIVPLYPGATQYLGDLRTPGQTWQDPVRGIQVRLVSMDLEQATIVVSRGTPVPRDETPPTIVLIAPSMGAVVARRSTVTLKAAAADAVGVVRVDFLVDGAVVDSRPVSGGQVEVTGSWLVPSRRNRTYRLTAQAYDGAGNVGVSAVVTVKSV